jgi:glycine C-acetyltransferase
VSVGEVARERLDQIRARGTHRRMRVLSGAQGPRMRVEGREVLVFAGSNSLDLAAHPEVADAAARAARDYGCAAGGSRLITGNLDLHEQLEEELADFVGSEAALVFPTGYMANLGAIPALVGEGDALVSDALNHASIVDAARLSRARVHVVPHGDLAALEAALAGARATARRTLLVVDGVYSMDGDVAPLREIAALARRHEAMLLVDDAHGTGTLGAGGRGSAEHCGALAEVDVVTGTLGKALGSFGAFVAGSRALRELLVNAARSFIFTCGLAPPQAEAARAALRVLRREPWRRWALQCNAARLRDRLAEAGISTRPSTTHIVPVVLGASDATMRVCEELLERGFYAQGIRPPSVAPGTARLRLTPMATHRPDEVDALARALVELVGGAASDAARGDERSRVRRGAA